MTGSHWYRPGEDHVVVTVRLSPGAGADRIAGAETLADGSAVLRAAVTAPPEKGKANKALIALLAKKTKIAKGRWSVVSGETSRTKKLKIDGDAAEIAAALDRMTG